MWHESHSRDTPQHAAGREHGKQCFAFSPATMEQYSASSGDHWAFGPDEYLVDAAGEPMVLAVKVTRYIDPFDGADLLAAP